MKKIKIMLSALAVLTVVGGALAFKAKTFLPGNVYCSTFPSPNTCQAIPFQTTENGTARTNPCGSGVNYYTDGVCLVPTTTTIYDTPSGQ